MGGRIPSVRPSLCHMAASDRSQRPTDRADPQRHHGAYPSSGVLGPQVSHLFKRLKRQTTSEDSTKRFGLRPLRVDVSIRVLISHGSHWHHALVNSLTHTRSLTSYSRQHNDAQQLDKALLAEAAVAVLLEQAITFCNSTRKTRQGCRLALRPCLWPA